MAFSFADRVVVVTGAAGTIGSALIRRLVGMKPREVIAIDSNESGLFELKLEFAGVDAVQFFVGDIADSDHLAALFRGVDFVFHAAALKHVELSERSPSAAIRTNVLGVESVIRAAQRCNVQRVLFTSSDKAVNPTSVMGVSKLLGERLFSIAGGQRNEGGARTVFCSVRFGNVAGSRGSVIPIFCGQIARGENLTLTDPAMSRFFMSTDRAIDMLIFAIEHAQGGEVFITKMKALMVERLAYVLRDTVAPAFAHDPKTIAIETIGARAGEKLYEELLSVEEVHRTEQLPDYYVVLPPTASGDAYRKAAWSEYATGKATQPVSSASESMMDDSMIRDMLRSPGALAQDIQLLLGIKPLATGTVPGQQV